MPVPMRPALIDFSALGQIGESLGKGLAQRRLANAFPNGMPMKDGVPDYGAAAQTLFGIGRPELALSLISKTQREGLTPYQQETLRLQRERLGFEQGQARQPKIGSTTEGIRSKLARGEQLTPGEQKVYDDALRSDPLLRFLMGGTGGGGEDDSAPLLTNRRGELEKSPAAPQLPTIPGAIGPRVKAGEMPPQGATPQLQGGQRTPSQQSINLLHQHRNDPDVIRQFDEMFGPGSAERILSGASPN